jgi:hypothetical protein
LRGRTYSSRVKASQPVTVSEKQAIALAPTPVHVFDNHGWPTPIYALIWSASIGAVVTWHILRHRLAGATASPRVRQR